MELWGRQYSNRANANANANSCSDLDHALTDELEFYLDRVNAAALRYGKRPERRDDEWCKRVVGLVCCVRRHGLLVRCSHVCRRRYGHDHSDIRFSERYGSRDRGDPCTS